MPRKPNKDARRWTLSPGEIEEVNARFCEEAKRYGLRYRCADCVHERPADHSCVLGYPNAMLADGQCRALDERGEYVFCKDFELGDA